MKNLFGKVASLLGLCFVFVALFANKEADAQSGGCCSIRKYYPEYGDCWPTTVNCLQTVVVIK